MLRMDSGSKCTWYKFIKGVGGGGAVKLLVLSLTDRGGKTIRCSCTAELLKSTLLAIIFLHWCC